VCLFVCLTLFLLGHTHSLTHAHTRSRSQIGAPVRVDKKPLADITNEDIDRVHNEFMNAMIRLFDRTKHKHGVEKDAKLDIC
jgi:hypothetical protein